MVAALKPGVRAGRAVQRQRRPRAGADVDPSGEAFKVGDVKQLFDTPRMAAAGSDYDVTADGQRFLMVRDNNWGEMAGTPTLVVVQGFFDELRAKLKK